MESWPFSAQRPRAGDRVVPGGQPQGQEGAPGGTRGLASLGIAHNTPESEAEKRTH